MRFLRVAVVALALTPVAGTVFSRAPRVHVVPFTPTELRIAMPASDGADGFDQMVSRAKPRAATNGTYYGTDYKPLGLLRSGGKWLFRNGRMRTVYTVDRAGKARIVSRDAVRANPARYPFALAAGPLLLKDGKVALNPEKEGFRPASRRIRAPRTALGIRRDGKGVIVVHPDSVTLAEFAKSCQEAGAIHAVNLDGGSATALYNNGRTVMSPPLPMTNVVLVGGR